MKKMFFSIFVSFFMFFSFSPIFANTDGTDCSYDSSATADYSVSEELKWCTPKGSIVSEKDGDNNYGIETGIKTKIINITNKLIIAGSILSVGGIVFAAILYVTALGSDEKVKKAKSALQFSIIGFIVMLLSFPIVNALVNLIYGIGSPTPATTPAGVNNTATTNSTNISGINGFSTPN